VTLLYDKKKHLREIAKYQSYKQWNDLLAWLKHSFWNATAGTPPFIVC